VDKRNASKRKESSSHSGYSERIYFKQTLRDIIELSPKEIDFFIKETGVKDSKELVFSGTKDLNQRVKSLTILRKNRFLAIKQWTRDIIDL